MSQDLMRVEPAAAARSDEPADRLTNLQRLGRLLAASGYFADARDMAQAAVKVMAGEELGIPPIASMMGVNIIQGKVALGANLIASRIRAHGYDYRVKQLDDKGCVIQFIRKGEVLGESSFSLEDAQKAGLTGKGIWKTYPRNMYFARAISNGARWYTPEVFGGAPVYTPEELGAEVDSDGDVIHRAAPAEPPIDTGGHPVGTSAARDYVRDKKLAAIRAAQEKPAPEPAPAPEPPSPPPGATPEIHPDVQRLWSMMTGVQQVFEVLKGLKASIVEVSGSDAGYYRILGESGWKSAADAKGKPRGVVRQVVKALWEYLDASRRAVAEPPASDPHEITDDDIPAVLGGTWNGDDR